MENAKKRAMILASICVIVLIAAICVNYYLNRNYLVEIKYNEVMEKVKNKESFILLLSQTTCSHCADYKPKLSKVAKDHKIKVYYLEVDLLSENETTNLKKIFNYDGTPVTIFVADGYEKTAATRITGDVSTEKIISKFKSNGYIK